MEKTKKLILNIIYGFAGFSLLKLVFELLIVVIKSTYEGLSVRMPLLVFILMLITSLTVLVLTIISFFKKNWGIKLAAFISQGALILIILVLFLVDFNLYAWLWQTAFNVALIFLIDMFIKKTWKYKRGIPDSNAEKNMENSKKIVLSTIYGFSALYLLVGGFDELVNFIAGTRGEFLAGTIITFIAFFVMVVLTTISFFSKNRGIKIAALISQGTLFLVTFVLWFVNGNLFSYECAFRSILIFLIDMFVNKIWKSKQNEPIQNDFNQDEM